MCELWPDRVVSGDVDPGEIQAHSDRHAFLQSARNLNLPSLILGGHHLLFGVSFQADVVVIEIKEGIKSVVVG